MLEFNDLAKTEHWTQGFHCCLYREPLAKVFETGQNGTSANVTIR